MLGAWLLQRLFLLFLVGWQALTNSRAVELSVPPVPPRHKFIKEAQRDHALETIAELLNLPRVEVTS